MSALLQHHYEPILAQIQSYTLASMYQMPQLHMNARKAQIIKSQYLEIVSTPKPLTPTLERNFRTVLGLHLHDPTLEAYLMRLIAHHMGFKRLRDPHVLDYRLGLLSQVEHLRIPLTKLLSKRPSLLLMDPYEVLLRVRNLDALLAEQDCARNVILRNPSVLTWSPERLDIQLANLAAMLRSSVDEVLDAMRWRPDLIAYKVSTLAAKVAFLVSCMQADRKLVEQFFRLPLRARSHFLGCSPKVLARVAYLLHLSGSQEKVQGLDREPTDGGSLEPAILDVARGGDQSARDSEQAACANEMLGLDKIYSASSGASAGARQEISENFAAQASFGQGTLDSAENKLSSENGRAKRVGRISALAAGSAPPPSPSSRHTPRAAAKPSSSSSQSDSAASQISRTLDSEGQSPPPSLPTTPQHAPRTTSRHKRAKSHHLSFDLQLLPNPHARTTPRQSAYPTQPFTLDGKLKVLEELELQGSAGVMSAMRAGVTSVDMAGLGEVGEVTLREVGPSLRDRLVVLQRGSGKDAMVVLQQAVRLSQAAFSNEFPHFMGWYRERAKQIAEDMGLKQGKSESGPS